MTHQQISSFVPIHYWRGGRLPIVDLEPDQAGWLICLTLQRAGDLSLLPLAWHTQAMDEHHTPETAVFPTVDTTALDADAVQLTLQQLEADGWEINGRLQLTFTGRHTDPTFHQTTQTHLWHRPS